MFLTCKDCGHIVWLNTVDTHYVIPACRHMMDVAVRRIYEEVKCRNIPDLCRELP